jgi:hypothetical protein
MATAQGRIYVYLPTNKKYNYPKVSGLLYNTNEKRFSFLSPIDNNDKAIGSTYGNAIRDFQKLNPGVSIVKVDIKRIGSTPSAPSVVIPSAPSAPSVVIPSAPSAPSVTQPTLPTNQTVTTTATTETYSDSSWKKYVGIGIAGLLLMKVLGGKKRKR